MKRMNLRKTLIAAALAGATALGTTGLVSAQPGGYESGYGMGHGMMGGGMMGGMMGAGMMGGHGPGYGMGPGMMGPGMMGGYGPYGGLNLSDEQSAKIAEIQQAAARKQWDLMSKMHEQAYQMHQIDFTGKPDDSATRKAYQAMADAHKAMFETTLDARKRIDAVLTKEQREQLRRGGLGGR